MCPISVDGAWRGPLAGSLARLPALDQRKLRSQLHRPSDSLAKPRAASRRLPLAWVALAAVPVLRHRLPRSVAAGGGARGGPRDSGLTGLGWE